MSIPYRSERNADKMFFANNPLRQYRARRYTPDDSPLPFLISLFDDDGTGSLSEVNLVIVRRILGGRKRVLFAAREFPTLNADWSIAGFLLSRGIDPISMKRVDRR